MKFPSQFWKIKNRGKPEPSQVSSIYSNYGNENAITRAANFLSRALLALGPAHLKNLDATNVLDAMRHRSFGLD